MTSSTIDASSGVIGDLGQAGLVDELAGRPAGLDDLPEDLTLGQGDRDLPVVDQLLELGDVLRATRRPRAASTSRSFASWASSPRYQRAMATPRPAVGPNGRLERVGEPGSAAIVRGVDRR